MYRHDPGVMLNAPLRTMIYTNTAGKAVFVIERPSDQFGAFENKEISKVGVSLDQKVAALLRVLQVLVPEGLSEK